jgi:hypothetical protein
MVLMAWTQFFLTTLSISIIFITRGNPTKASMKRMAEEMICRVKAAIRSCKFNIAMIELWGGGNSAEKLHQRTDSLQQ